jgi:probable F420-dependent oxidoreductase
MGDHPSWGGLDVTVALMAAAAATTTLRVASHVFANDFHNPVLLAQAIATLDLLSDGRMEFGLGAGWLRSDFEVCAVPFDPHAVRLARMEEALQVIKGLWSEDVAPFTGSYYQVPDLNPTTKPQQRPHPPIYIGGRGRRILTLAAREADIVGVAQKSPSTTPAEDLDQQVAWVREAAGPRFPGLELETVVVAVRVTEDRQHGAEEIAAEIANMPVPSVEDLPTAAHILASPAYLVGTVEQMVEDLQARRERYGISYISVFGDYVDTLSPVVARLTGT